MDSTQLKGRTRQFAPRLIKHCGALPRSRAADVPGRQLLRSGTSVGANDRAACRARSCADFTAKTAIVDEEADECAYRLDLIVESGLMKTTRAEPLLSEAEELTAIASASWKTSRSRRNRQSTIDSPQSTKQVSS